MPDAASTLDAAAARSGPSARPAVVVRLSHQRVRLAVYGAFIALATAVAAYGGLTVSLERQQLADQEIAARAAALQSASQRAARQVTVVESGGEARAAGLPELRRALVRVSIASQDLDRAVAARPGERGAATLATAQAATRRATERLSEHAQALLAAAERRAEADLSGAAGELRRRADEIVAGADALQASVGESARERALLSQHALAALATFGALLLAALAVAVVEPLARAIRRQSGELDRQAADLQRLALVGESTSALVILSDLDHRILWVNPAFTRQTGWSAAEAEGALPLELMQHPLGSESERAALREAVAEGRPLRTVLLCRRRDGSDLWLDIELRPVTGGAGAPAGFITVGHDVTVHAAEQRKLQLLWSALPAGVVVVSAGGEVADVNRAGERLLGQPREMLLGRGLGDARCELLREDGRAYQGDHPAERTLATGQPVHDETVGVRTTESGLRWLLVNTEPLLDEGGRVAGAVCCFSDVTERRQLQEQLRQSARIDPLTALPNRAVVMERLQRALTHAKAHTGYGFAVLFMDFDRFKQVNDTLGHTGGDELLRQVAARLRVVLRPGDEVARVDSGSDLAARMGGDEFVVVLDGIRDVETVAAVADRLLREVSEPYTVLDQPVQSGVSVGIVLVTDGAPQVEDAEALLRDADTAMYEAKRAGRGRWVLFDRSMHDRLLRTVALETDLRRALRAGELFVVYQPVVELDSGRLAGVEALVRWQHPERGLVMPMDFIPVAEECGLIDAIGQQVLTMATGQFMDWQRRFGERAPGLLAVNLSRAQLERAELVGDVVQVLLEAGMPAQALQLEVTETLAAQDERVQATLRELKARGVRLALDDFGTGYSSLACLHQLPVDTVKVDRSFVRHAETVEYHRVLIEATIRVARTLGMTTVAEGIETEGQAALMTALACDRGQGWLFGRPMTPPDLELWLQSQVAGGVPA